MKGLKISSFVSFSKSRACEYAVDDECFPDRSAMYVGPEYVTAEASPPRLGSMTMVVYTDGISVCFSATTQSWSGSFTLYCKCIRIGACSFAAGKPNATLHLSSKLPKKHFSGPSIETSSSVILVVAVQNLPSSCFLLALFSARISPTGFSQT